MVKITEENLSVEDVEDLRKKCARVVNRAGDGQSEISKRIRGVKLLWHRKRFQDARVEAERAAKDFPKSGEASLILGRTYLYQSPPDYAAADEAFKEANLKKCKDPSLLEYWSLARLKKNDVPGLLKITNNFLVPNISGLSLLYRLVGLYRNARVREEAKDFAGAFRGYEILMLECVKALSENRTEPVTGYVNRLASAVSDYFIETAYLTFKRESIDRILDLTSRLAADGFPPSSHLERIATDALRVTKSDRYRQPQTIRKRVERLYSIGRQLSKSHGGRHQFTQCFFHAAREVESS